MKRARSHEYCRDAWVTGNKGRAQIGACFLAVFVPLISTLAWADLPIIYVNESSLPYDLSSANYDNSPVNYDNSLVNYKNSSINFKNSNVNFENSPSNFDNGLGGGHRLYYKADNLHMTWAGYYVAKSGYVNFFSPGGNRIFYKPSNHIGVFSAEDGSFCGALATVGGQVSLALTSHGTEVFAKLNAQ